MAPHSSTLAWKIPWMEEPGGLQSMTSLRVGHDWATSLSCIEERNGSPLQYSCLENPRDGGAWWAAIYGVAQSWTWLKWLSSSSSIYSFFLDLFLHWSPVAYWAPTDLGNSSFSILSFYLFISIERSYQTHSHKITRLVRMSFLISRNMFSSKMHCYYIIISTQLKEKHLAWARWDFLLCTHYIQA